MGLLDDLTPDELKAFMADIRAIALNARPYTSLELGVISTGMTLPVAASLGPFQYGGFAAKELTGTNPASCELVDDNGQSGAFVEPIDLLANETARENYPVGVLVTGGQLRIANVTGSMSLTLRIREGIGGQ